MTGPVKEENQRRVLLILRGNPTMLSYASDRVRAFQTTTILTSLIEQSVNTALAIRMANVAEIKQKVLARRQ